MEISIMRKVGIEDLERFNFDCTELVNWLVDTVKSDIADKVKFLSKEDKDAVVTVTSKYLSDGIKKEPTDDQRSQLSALSKVHKVIMDKAKGDGNGFEDLLYYGKLAGIVVNLMKEIENG